MDSEKTKLPMEENLTKEALADPKTLAEFIVSVLDSKKARDIRLLHVEDRTIIADYFVIASVAGLRQLSSLTVNIEDKLAEEGIIVGHVEGKGDSGWILMDYGDIIVNLFTAEQREHYNIEKVWADCDRINYEQSE